MGSAPGSVPLGNRLLDRLARRERARIAGACELVPLVAGATIAASGDVPPNVHFPTRGAISSMLAMGDGRDIEVALTGSEGVHGATSSQGAACGVTAIVRIPGAAWRIGAAPFRTALRTLPALAEAIARYKEWTVRQLFQEAGCNRFHSVEQRVARRLLMASDRAHSATLPLTHDALAHALGVRRVGVTNAAGALQRRNLIAYGRGMVAILDRKGLEAAACGCYRGDLRAYKRAL